MIDMEAEIKRIAAETLAKFAAKPVIQAKAMTDTQFAAAATVGKFQSLLGGDQFQAACGMFCRMVAMAAAMLDEPSDRVGEILLNGARRDLAGMWQFVSESQQTDPDAGAVAEFGLMRDVMVACVASHAARSDRRRQFFQSAVGDIGAGVLPATAVDWLLCR